MARNARVPSFRWALDIAHAYLRGKVNAQAYCAAMVDALDYYKRTHPTGTGIKSTLYDFVATSWVGSIRVIQGKDDDTDLRNLVTEWLPDLERTVQRRLDPHHES